MDGIKCTKVPPKCPKYRGGKCAAISKCRYQSSFTNADRIRAMSDEDLAKANVRRTRKTSDEYCWPVYITSDGEEFENYEIALKHETEWLQQPVKEDNA